MYSDFEPACQRMEWLDPFYKAVWEKAFAGAIPISGTFELTPRCNFNCRMCYVHLKPEQMPRYGRELTAKEWLRIAEEAREAGTTWLCVTGGEPLLHPEFEIIWRELAQMGFFITLQTNASLIQGKMADLFRDCPPRSAKITLYGSDNEVYKRVCKVDDGFTNADRGIQNLRELKIPVELVSTVIRQNAEDIGKMARYAYQNRLPWMPAGGIRPSVRGADVDMEAIKAESSLSIDERRERIERLVKERPMDMKRKPCTYCKDYRLGYWVVWNGDMRFCSFMNEPNIPVRDMAFAEAWEKLVAYEETLDWPKECKTCEVKEACYKCAATLETECGSPHKVTKEFCDKVKRRIKGEE